MTKPCTFACCRLSFALPTKECTNKKPDAMLLLKRHLSFCSDDDDGPSGGSPPKQLKPSTGKPSMAVPSDASVEGNEERMNSKKKRIRPDVIGGGGGGSKTAAATPSDEPMAATQRKFEPCHLSLLFQSKSGLNLCDFT